MMTLRVPTYLRIAGVHFAAAKRLVLESAFIPSRPPDRVSVDGRSLSKMSDWERASQDSETDLLATWRDENVVLSLSTRHGDQTVGRYSTKAGAAVHSCSLQDWLTDIEEAPSNCWAVTSSTSSTSVVRGTWSPGWGLALKPTARQLKVLSPRVLERGPWLVREYGDLTLILFHELDAGSAAKREQCRAGHEWMFGNGGALVSDRVQAVVPDGATYLASSRRLDIAVHGRTVPTLEMAEARELWMRQALGSDRPIDLVTYSFADPREAEVHLYDLWLRGLEVVTFVDGHRTVLTDGYEPPLHEPPEWTHRLAARLAEQGL